ncbi:MAG: PAS domain S-box protein [Cytophagales bacterium]|nr:PAS domain S-box protein [Cytophaga sp.]
MDVPLKILMLEDVPDDLFLVEYELKKSGLSFITAKADSRASFIAALNEFEPDIILSDHSLPDINSIEALEITRQRGNTPFILVTGTVSEEFAVYCLKKGVDDYLLKNNLTRLITSIQSVTRQRQIEEERNIATKMLAKSEKRFRSMIENASDLIIIINKKNNIEYTSSSIKNILGYEAKELVGQSLLSYIHDGDVEKTLTSFQNCFSGDKISYTEWQFKDSENNWRYFESTGKFDPELNNVILNSRDVTIRKLAEHELVVKNTELQKINKELDQFVYSASHDLRAPLKSLLGLINLSYHEYQSKNFDPLLDYLEKMEKSIHKLDRTIIEIIQYSKNARTCVTDVEIDIEEFIQEILEKFQLIDKLSDITVHVTVQNKWPLIADKQRLEVIISNLLDNSIKYSKQKKYNPFIHIEVVVTAEKVRFVIKDNGIGIKDEYQSKIFDMFYRATESSDGSGLGLYIVKEISEKLNGSISVSSVPNEETIFTLEIPNCI